MSRTYIRDINRAELKKDSNRLNKMSTKKNTVKGIDTTTLMPLHVSLIKDRLFSHITLDNDITMKILFKCIDQEEDRKTFDKIYFIKKLDVYITENQINDYNEIYKWKCIECDCDILINGNTKIIHTDFLCKKCFNDSKRSMKVKQNIIEEFKSFNSIIIDKTKKDFKYIKKKIEKNRT